MGTFGKPKFKKVNETTIRITIEKTDDVELIHIVKNRDYLEQQKAQAKAEYENKIKGIDQTLKNIDEVLAQAKKLGIIVKEEVAPVQATKPIKETK
jgi:hypothetical protein